MFSEELEAIDPYRGLNPDFVRRVHAKRRAEAERAKTQMRASEAIAKAREEAFRSEVEAELRAMARAREAELAMMLPQTAFRRIEHRACATFNLLRSELYADRQTKKLVFARQFVAYWASRLTQLSFPQIGKLMGGFDHTTMLAARTKYIKRRAEMGRTLRRVR